MGLQEAVKTRSNKPKTGEELLSVVEDFKRERKEQIVKVLNASPVVKDQGRHLGLPIPLDPAPEVFCVSSKSMQYVPRDETEARELVEDEDTDYVENAQVYLQRTTKKFVYCRGSEWEARQFMILNEAELTSFIINCAAQRDSQARPTLCDSKFKSAYSPCTPPTTVEDLWDAVHDVIRTYYRIHAEPEELADQDRHVQHFFSQLQRDVLSGVSPQSVTSAVVAVRVWTSDVKGPVHDKAFYSIVNWVLITDESAMMRVCAR